MSTFILTLASFLAIGTEARPMLALVPEGSTPEQCFVVERIASVIALTPNVRIVRARVAGGEALDAARARVGADLAIDGARREDAAGEAITVSIARAGTPPAKIDTGGKDPQDRVWSALASIWPKDLPKLAEVAMAGAANHAALAAACRGDAAAAYGGSGDAIGRAVRELVAPPLPDKKTLLARWARAAALKREGKLRPAAEMLRGIVAALSRGESAPVWRRAPSAAIGSSIDLFDRTAVAFEGGAFRAIDVSTGLDLWRLELGKSEPHLTDAGSGLVLAALEKELVAIDLTDGKITWRVPMDKPSPEIAQGSGRIYAAGEDDVFALDRLKGDIVWKYDPLTDMIAGPTLAGANLAVPAESSVVLLDPSKGDAIKKIDLGDEISAPLTITPKGSIWAMVGGDQIVLVDPATSEIRLRAMDLPGAEWPPALISDQLVIAFRKTGRRAVAFLDPAAKNGVRRMYPGASPPLVALPSFAGVVHTEERPIAIVARDLDGNVLWRSLERSRITTLEASGDVVLTAAGTKVRVLEPKKGAPIAEIELSEAVKKVALGPSGGVVLVESGAIYGIPSLADLRPKAWLRNARLELGQCLLELGDVASAVVAAKQVLERDPEDLDALALYAAAEEKTKPKESAERWRTVAIAAPKGDPLQAEVDRALAALAGIDSRVVLDRPILDVVPNGAEAIVVRTDEGVAGMLLEPSLAPLWTKKGAADLRALFPGHVLAGGDLLKSREGIAVRKIAALDALVLGGLVLHLKPNPAELTRENVEGAIAWTQTFDVHDVAVLDANERFIFVAGVPPDVAVGARTQAQILRSESGDRVWLLPLGEPIKGAWLSGNEVLVLLEKKVVGLDVETGKQLFAAAIPVAEVERASAIERGWIVAAKNKLRIVEKTRGRVLPPVVLPAALAALEVVKPDALPTARVPPQDVAILSLEGGLLAAFDVATNTLAGRLNFGPIRSLARAGTRVMALEETGALLVIDAGRKLKK